MKSFLILILLISVNSFSQVSDDKVYTISDVDISPEFDGGTKALYMFIAKTYRVPSKVKKDAKVVIEFIIEKDGTLTNMKIVENPGYKCGEELIRVMEMSPIWKPGEKAGLAVRTIYNLPLIVRKGD